MIRAAALLFAAVAVAAAAAAAVQDPSVGELSRRIARGKDGTDPEVFRQLAAYGSSEALDALERGLRAVDDAELRAALFDAIAEFADVPELAKSAARVLENEVRKGKNVAYRLAAARAILAFDPVELADGWAIRHKDDVVQALFSDALVVHWAERDDAESVRRILDGASLSVEAGVRYLGVPAERAELLAESPHREVVRDMLGRLSAPDARAELGKAVGEKGRGRAWKLLLLRILRHDPSADAAAALAAACSDRDASIALLAVEFVLERPDDEAREKALEPLLDSKEPALRRAAVVGLGLVHKTDAGFRARLLELAESSDEATRMGAAAALAEVRTTEALEALVAMIPDEDWSVRVEVLKQLFVARPKAAVPVLIERMELEMGRMRRDVHAALVGLTGIDMGRRPDPWRQWWAGEGEAFEVPTAAAAQRALDNLVERRAAAGGTAAVQDFYRIEVASERVVFVLDTSGSMRLPVEAVGTIEKTRMELAKEQLTEVVRSLPDETLFNVVFFETEVRALSRKMVPMNKSNRAKALRFVREQYSMGATALYPALELAFSDPLVDTIYLLSDGAPTEGEITDIEEIRAEVARWNSARHVKIHGISMGQDSTLLGWLCADTGGEYRRVD